MLDGAESEERIYFLLILLMTPVADQVKTRLSKSQAEAEEQTNDNASSQALRVLPFCLQLRQSSFTR